MDSVASSQRTTITNVVGDERQDSIETEAQPDNNEEDTPPILTEKTFEPLEPSSVKKKKKLSHSEERLQLLRDIAQRGKTTPTQLDETDLFFSSMAQIVKKLPRHEQIQLRMQIGSLVGNAELRSISNDSNQQFIISPMGSTTPDVSTDASEILSSASNERRFFSVNDKGDILLNM